MELVSGFITAKVATLQVPFHHHSRSDDSEFIFIFDFFALFVHRVHIDDGKHLFVLNGIVADENDVARIYHCATALGVFVHIDAFKAVAELGSIVRQADVGIADDLVIELILDLVELHTFAHGVSYWVA